MIASIALLVACQAIGEFLNRLSGLPVPGSVLGMFLLLGWLALRRSERPALDKTADWLIGHMSVFFVPAAVGVMAQGAVLARYGLAIGLATVVSTLATLAVSVGVFRLVAGRTEVQP